MTAHDSGQAGGSARREYQRRRAAREAATRAKHPKIAGLLLAIQDAPASETRWRNGGEGEELVAQALRTGCPDIPIFHDRRIPRSRANIDHIAIAPSGVWVIDTKRYTGKVRVEQPWFSKPKLMIAGRDRTKLVDGLARQVEHVRVALGGLETPVRGCFCFVGADLPLFGTQTINGFEILWRKKLVKRLNSSGPISREQRTVIGDRVRAAFRRTADP